MDGRIDAQQGIPYYSQLTVMAHGVRWVDQQRLAQVVFYELQRLGGYALLVVLDVGLVAAALGLAIFAARDRFQSTYDKRGISLVDKILANARSAKVVADVRFADWLLWQDPALAGHVAYDTSFELLATKDLEAFAAIYQATSTGTPARLRRSCSIKPTSTRAGCSSLAPACTCCCDPRKSSSQQSQSADRRPDQTYSTFRGEIQIDLGWRYLQRN